MDRYKTADMVAVHAIKCTAGFFSQAMIADGFNSAGDVFASIVAYSSYKSRLTKNQMKKYV